MATGPVTIRLRGQNKDLDARLRKMVPAADRKASVEVGFMAGATEADGTPVSAVAAWNEFGDGNRPPRPFFRNTIDERSAAWGHNLGVALVKSKFNAPLALGLVGMGMKEDVQQSIRTLTEPPLSPGTIARKSMGKSTKIRGVLGPAKPLIDTGTMLNSVTFRVKTG
jgi:hypothetical protein